MKGSILAVGQEMQGIYFAAGTVIYYDGDSKIERVYLASVQTIEGIKFPAKSTLWFSWLGKLERAFPGAESDL